MENESNVSDILSDRYLVLQRDNWWDVFIKSNYEEQNGQINSENLIILSIERKTTVEGEDVYFIYTDESERPVEVTLTFKAAIELAPDYE